MDREVAKLKNALISKFGWSGTQLEIGMNANFCCQYCGKNLLESVDTYLWIWQVDHIKPRSKQGEDKEENMAVSCLTCNNLKSNLWLEEWEGLDKPACIHRIADYLKGVRAIKERRLLEMKGIIEQLRQVTVGKK